MKLRSSWICLVGVLTFLAGTSAAADCSCAWKGAFLEVSKDSPLIIHGRVLRHHNGLEPAMDVLVLDTLAGGLLDSGLRIHMGDGAACRPGLTDFEPGSEWILALNGSGSKPGTGWALSHCGEYSLRVETDEVVGIIEGFEKKTRRMPLSELKNRIRYPRFDVRFSGQIKAGETFWKAFGGRFQLVLEPTSSGWIIMVQEAGHVDDLSRLTPPFHAAPNPREIEGWHLLDQPTRCRTRPYQAESGPSHPREFIFSPDVGRRIDGPDAKHRVTAEEVEEVRRFGRGILRIDSFELKPNPDGCPAIQQMAFSVWLTGGY